jgi:lipopolysaccharide transport system permease protein
MALYHVVPPIKIVFLPVFFVLTLVVALGVGLWLSALNVQYRDVRYTVPFLTQFWMFATPIAYPASLLHEPWRTVYGLNPMVGVVEGFRWTLLGTKPPGSEIIASSVAAILILIGGAFYFRRMERTFADIV